MAFFVRIVGAVTNNDYMAPKIMIYMNDHNWHDGIVTQQASDEDLDTILEGGPGMYLRLYVRSHPNQALLGKLSMIYTHVFGKGVYARSTREGQDLVYDTIDFSTTLDARNYYVIKLGDAYAQAWFFMAATQSPLGYLTLDYSLIMAREVLKMKSQMSDPGSLFNFMYEKGSGPLIYDVRYYIKTRQGAANGDGYRLASTYAGELYQTTATDPTTHFRFLHLHSTDKKNAYAIKDHWGTLLCITDQGLIERRPQPAGPWEEFEVAPDWSKPGSFTITKRFDNDPYGVYGFRFSPTPQTTVSTWLVGSDVQGTNDIFEIMPVAAGEIY